MEVWILFERKHNYMQWVHRHDCGLIDSFMYCIAYKRCYKIRYNKTIQAFKQTCFFFVIAFWMIFTSSSIKCVWSIQIHPERISILWGIEIECARERRDDEEKRQYLLFAHTHSVGHLFHTLCTLRVCASVHICMRCTALRVLLPMQKNNRN